MNNPSLGKTILIVEDNNEVRFAIEQALQLEGYSILSAIDGIDALQILTQFPIDLILSDINMPVMDGIGFYKELRKNPIWVTIPFIFLTANDSSDQVQAGRELGVEDYLVKPVKLDHLLGTIHARLLRATEIKLTLINEAYLDTVKVLANTIEGRDPYTRGHVERVSMYARWIANELGWTSDRIHNLEFGARLHDIGKIVIPDHILTKETPLNPDEWNFVYQHPIVGAKIIKGTSHLQDTLPYILYHHEKWNGSGYPCGLTEKDIPIEARLLAIVDVYDALTTNRSYHPARPNCEVIKYLEINAGILFDPDITPLFLGILKSKGLTKNTNGDGAETEKLDIVEYI
jgi:putative two-component system response regulator